MPNLSEKQLWQQLQTEVELQMCALLDSEQPDFTENKAQIYAANVINDIKFLLKKAGYKIVKENE